MVGIESLCSMMMHQCTVLVLSVEDSVIVSKSMSIAD